MKKIFIVGAGLYGSVLAERFSSLLNREVILIDLRAHIGGNCYSFKDNKTGVDCHKYGAHIFHTNSDIVFKYISNFTTLNNYRHKVFSRYNSRLYPMPINLQTINQFYNLTLTPSECEQFLNKIINNVSISQPKNLEEQAISLIGKDLYYAFIRQYTLKQWQRDPISLPSYIIKRLPFRTNYDNQYFYDKYQGIPINGYSEMFTKMLSNKRIKVYLNTKFSDVKSEIGNSDLLIFSGAIDELFDYRFGYLEWRSLDFEWETVDIRDFQGCAVINEADATIPYTRTHEFKHFHPENKEVYETKKTIICKEYSKEFANGDTPYYPVDTEKNRLLYSMYHNLLSKNSNVFVGGRLGAYKYMDMDQVILSALNDFNYISSFA